MNNIDSLVKSLSKHRKDLCGHHEKDTKPREFTYNSKTGKRINFTSTRPTKRKAKTIPSTSEEQNDWSNFEESNEAAYDFNSELELVEATHDLDRGNPAFEAIQSTEMPAVMDPSEVAQSLEQLCQTIYMELEQSRVANVPSGEWHQRIERREDSWETHRSCLFQYVVGTEKLLEHNEPGLCGTTRWKAAKVASKTMRNLDETGLVVAGCRHGIAQRAVNMFRGEIYGYTHYLHVNDFPSRNIKFIWQDVACQYWPWAEQHSMPEGMTPCIPVRHAKAHSWHRQILWGGRWQEGSAAGCGEDMEQIFSYLSRWGSTTKNMLAYRREEFLVEAAGFWNLRKVRSLSKHLTTRFFRVKVKLLEFEEKMQDIGVTDQMFHSYKREIECLARNELSHGFPDVDPRERYYILHKENQVIQQLVEYTTNNTAAESTLIALDDLYKHAQDMVKKTTLSNSSITEIEALLNIDNDVDRDNCLLQGRYLAIKRKLDHLAAEMEIVYLYVQKKEMAIQSQATSSKQRANLRHSVLGEKKKLKVCVMKYNNLAAMLPNTPCTSVEVVLKGEFPWWCLTGNRRSLETKWKLEVVEVFNNFNRWKEETSVLLEEMKNYLNYYYQHLIPLLDRDIAELNQELRNCATHRNQLITETELRTTDFGRYLSNNKYKTLINGKITILNKYRDQMMTKLRNGIEIFSKEGIDQDLELSDFHNDFDIIYDEYNSSENDDLDLDS